MQDIGTAFICVRAARLRATSAWADAPTVEPTLAELRAERRAHARRTRAPRPARTRLAAAGTLRRLADTLAPGGDLAAPHGRTPS